MSVFSLNSSHIGSRPPGQQQTWKGQIGEQQAKVSNPSVNLAQENTDRKISASSTGSVGSHSANPLRVRNENLAPMRSVSNTALAKSLEGLQSSTSDCRSSYASITSSWRNAVPLQNRPEHQSGLAVRDGTHEDIDLNSTDDSSGRDSQQGKHAGKNERRGLSVDAEANVTQATERPLLGDNSMDLEDTPCIVVPDPGGSRFKKFVNTIRPQPLKHKRTLSARTERWTLDDFDSDTLADLDVPKLPFLKGHHKASSWSSNGFATAVMSTTTSLGQAGAGKESDKGSRVRFLRIGNRSSRTSDNANRSSTDSNQEALRIADEAAWSRAVQRRKILEELMASEEGYISDLKILAHVCWHSSKN